MSEENKNINTNNDVSEEEKKQIAMLLSSKKMLEKTKKQMIDQGKDSSLIRLLDETSNNEVIKYDDNVNELSENVSYEQMFPGRDEALENSKQKLGVTGKINTKKEMKKQKENGGKETPIKVQKQEEKIIDSDDSFEYSFVDEDDDQTEWKYDIIPLPSKGECYSHKKGRIKVAYLTAADEDLITSPNLYNDGKIIDILLKRKILDKTIKVDELVKGDRDAIILWLRATAYGYDFPINVTDPETDEQFETTIDLSTLKIKEFNLKGDENGYFDYTLPVSKDEIKFKFLNFKEQKTYENIVKNENKKIEKIRLIDSIKNIKDTLESNVVLNDEFKENLKQIIEESKKWYDSIEIKDDKGYTKFVTTTLLMNIVSVNGNDDKTYIKKYIKTLNPMDSLSFRRYLISNEPSVDFNIEVIKPEGLGGGSMSTFLEFSDFVFLQLPKL